jgi:hypothetical protein
MSKGSGRRPLSVSQQQFADNWDKAFSKKQEQMELPFDNMLREVSYDGMWRHSCTTMMETFYIGKNEVCDACGAWEEDGL